MLNITLNKLTVDFEDRFTLHEIDWQISQDQHWCITGPNGSGKSALAAVLCDAGDIQSGQLSGLPRRVALVSFEAQAELIEAERRKDDADILDVISEGTTVQEMLNDGCQNFDRQQQLVKLLKFDELLQRSFRKLSTGETRKVLLIKALTSAAELLVLDEPFEGLDIESDSVLHELITQYSKQAAIVLVLNRIDEIPDFVTHIGYMENGRLIHAIDKSKESDLSELSQLLHLKTTDLTVPHKATGTHNNVLDNSKPLVVLKNARIAYSDNVVFENLNWTIEPGQHWQVSGPNGSGKTCLLNLITGDHPQCYVNNIQVFGMQRGKGESIWDIKQHIGYVSSALQWEYKVSVSVRNAIISGFYDSIGIYQKYTDTQKKIADDWLSLLALTDRADTPFNQLSFGDQRLVLIARAMVKHPPLLILDEPCLGLDELNRQLVLALIEKICADSETTVLYVNHRLQDKIAGIDNNLALP